MGQDGNTIEIEIDAAATVAAAKTAGEANAKLVKFDQALGLFRDNVGLVSKTTEDVASVMGDFNTILGKFADNLVTNLADMQTSVVQKIEPHLERELENMVNRVLNKVEAKTGTSGESRSRSEAKQGAAAPTVTNTTAANVATAKQDSEFKRPDAIIKQMSSQIGSTVQDAITGAFTDTKTSRMRTEVTRTKLRQYSDVETGEQLEERTVTTDISNAISKAVVKSSDAFGKAIPLTGENKKMADLFNFLQNPVSARPSKVASGGLQSISDALDQSLGKGFADPLQQYGKGMNAAAEQNIWRPYEKALNDNEKAAKSATVAEKDRGIAIRREITGALIGLHVMKVVSQYSAVANAGFMMVFAALGHLLNNILLPMMPAFIIFAQVLHTVANVIQMLPMPIRQLIGALLIWKATSMLVASMPLKDIKDGFAGIKQVMDGSATGLQKFTNLVRAFIDFMNSGQGKGAVSWIGSGVGSLVGKGKQLLGKRARGGPVLGHGAYIVGEKGPEIFVPKTSGSIIPNHKIGRADGVGDVAAAPTGSQAPILPDIGSTLLGGAMGAGLGYMFTGSPLVAAGGGILGAAAGASGADIIGTIAGGVGAMMSNDTVQGIMGGMHLLTNTLAAFLAPIAPMLGVIAGVVGVASGVRSGLGGGGDGGKTAETVATVGKAQLKQTAAMSYGVQNTVNAGTRGTSSSLMALLLRMNGCIKVAPCSPDAFGFTAAITSALPTALTLALGALAATITYTIITNGTVPIATPIATTITYTIKTVGEIPATSNIERFITWTRRVAGAIPVPESLKAYIDYVRRVVGTEPVATDKTATITYNIVKNGTDPVITNATAYIEYYIKTNGTIPTLENIVAYVEAKIGPLSPEQYAKLKAAVEAAAKADPAKIAVASDGTAVKVEAEATKLADKIPAGEKVIKEATAEADKITDKVPTEKKVIEGIKVGVDDVIDKVPDARRNLGPFRATVSDINTPTGTEVDVNPKVDEAFLRAELERVWKAIDDTRVKLMQDSVEYGSEEWVRLTKQIEDYTFDAKDIELRIAELKPPSNPVVSLKANIIDLITSEVKDKFVDVKGNVWEVTAKAGSTLTLKGLNGEIATVTYDPNRADVKEIKIWEAKVEKLTPTEKSITTMSDIISKRLASGEPSKAPVKPAVPEGFDYTKVFSAAGMESAGRAAGGFGVAAIGAYFSEWNTTGKPPELGDFMTRMVVGGLALMALPVVGNAIGAAIGGAAGAAVATGAGLVATGLTVLFVAAVAICAVDMAWDLMSGVAEAVRTGDWSNMNFGDNPVLNWAFEAGKEITVKQGTDWVLWQNNLRNDLLNNTNDMRTLIQGGIPVDVKFDIESINNIVDTMAHTMVGGNPDTYSPNIPIQQPGSPELDYDPNDPTQQPGNPDDYDPNNPTGLPPSIDPNPPSQCPEGQYFDSSLGVCVGGYGYAVGGRPPVNVPSLVGERGPELFIPDSSPTSIGGGGGGQNITITITGNTFGTNETMARELTDKIMRELKLEMTRVKM